jgi:hypothetical protein
MIRQAFWEESMNYKWTLGWYVCFGVDQISIEDDQYTGRPISSTMLNTVVRLQQLIYEDQHCTIQDPGDEVRIGYGTCQRILTAELSMHHVAAKFVSRILTSDQKQKPMSMSVGSNLLVHGYHW